MTATIRSLSQYKQRSRFKPFRVIYSETEGLGYFVGGFEAYAPNFAGETVRLIFDDGDGRVLVLLIYADGQRR